MRHRYQCQMRWADMDMLGHVNNVRYLDYLQEARTDLLSGHAAFAGSDPVREGVVVVRHEVEFVAPLVYRPEAVTVETWVSEVRAASFATSYEIVGESKGERTVYLRATSVIAPFDFAEERPRRLTREERARLEEMRDEPLVRSASIPTAPPDPPGRLDLHVRFSDVDAYGHVNNVTYFEYFQEARIQFMISLHRADDPPWSDWVVAATDVDYRAPMVYRAEPYEIRTWVESVGQTSTRLCAEIRDGDALCARSSVVMVAFDRETQRAAQMAPVQRQRLVENARAD